MTSYSSSADCPVSAAPGLQRVFCVAMSCVGGGYSWWCLRFCLGQCEADDWKIHLHFLLQYQEVVGVCMHAELLVSAAMTIFAQTTTTIPGSS